MAVVVPLLLVVFIYGCVLFVQLYRLYGLFRRTYSQRTNFWDGARTAIAWFWTAHGWIWHGYELNGFDNIPEEGAALIVYYHGTLPIDIYYLLGQCILYKHRLLHCVADKMLQNFPGWKLLMEVLHIWPGSVDSCVAALKSGHILCISPGGVREALFSSSEKYELIWKDRFGFAKVALEAKVPVIPMFTMNCREAFRTPVWGRKFFQKIYERWKIPLTPIYGGFPVKLRTYLGNPFMPSDDDSQESLRNKIKTAIENLIILHQRRPGNIFYSLIDRFY